MGRIADKKALTATYRLQLHKDFPFSSARAILPFLRRLGVSHVYTSPVFSASPGSAHGYDVTDPTTVNSELGGEGERIAFVDALREEGLSWMLDIVPNHMGTGSTNRFWDDVLAHGRGSRYARWFDIDWDPSERWLREKVMLPVLGDELESVLERSEISVVRDRGKLRIKYGTRTFPLSPESLEELEGGVESIAGAATGSRSIDGERSDSFPGGAPRVENLSPTRLRALLDAQHYALASWRRASREINYRRFFDINDLVALRAEDPSVFDDLHAVPLKWIAADDLQALRIDHIDGLADPLAYLRRLNVEVSQRIRERQIAAASQGTDDSNFPNLPIVVEKILSSGEQLRQDWPVHGTTGYEFLNDLAGVFIDADGALTVDAFYRRLLRLRASSPGFEEITIRGKLRVLREGLHADLRWLGRLLAPLAKRSNAYGNPTCAELEEGIALLIACLPVYRTYLDARSNVPHPDDRRVLRRALSLARERANAAPAVLTLLEDVLLGINSFARDSADADLERMAFVQRFQQTSGPAMAKGLEDTALYMYVPLASRNEVGGDPDRELEDAVEVLHRANGERAKHWPLSLVTTNTHDAKRSADVRSRLHVLSELPMEWEAGVREWHRLNRAHRVKINGRFAPDINTEYLLYQSLIGIWPLQTRRAVDELPESSTLDELRDRLGEYMLKAVREAKMRTSWTEPNSEFESALSGFVQALLDPSRSPAFLGSVARMAVRLAKPGLWNALSRTVVHFTVPGTPDLYQGDELWRFALVDPDNRRPVDYAARERLLIAMEAEFDRNTGKPVSLVSEMAREVGDGRLKLHVIRRLMLARRQDPDFWRLAGYEPVRAHGARARHIVAFARRLGDRCAITVAARLTAGLAADPVVCAPVGDACWGDSWLPAPSLSSTEGWTCALSGGSIRPVKRNGGEAISLAQVFRSAPVAVLLSPGTLDAF
ncbi:MAG: malto-oligosyltrehalose synthase [Gemmatimonadaceae bacterium]|nr:malto-oligosyltrehalose synthase [Gemmatimonadaceae bacterium]